MPRGASVLDVACGTGRHVRWFAQRGAHVTGIDRDSAAVAPLHSLARIVVADLEGRPWPLPGQVFDAVIVTNYLWRPLLPTLVDSVAPGGVLLYETFSRGHEAHGRPRNPDFLLRDGELLGAAHGLHVLAYESGLAENPTRVVQRLAAVKTASGAEPARALTPPGTPSTQGE